MAELGDIVGALMAGLLRARCIADEQTAALAERYRDNPLLEGLSVPRIRIPELVIDMPILIEDFQDGERAEMVSPEKIIDFVFSRIKLAMSGFKKKIPAAFHESFTAEAERRLLLLQRQPAAMTREAVVRVVQGAFSVGVSKSGMVLEKAEFEQVAKDIRLAITELGLLKESVNPKIIPNIKTSEVKERATAASVVRLKVTFKEEGLEWAVQASEDGGVARTLQPE